MAVTYLGSLFSADYLSGIGMLQLAAEGTRVARIMNMTVDLQIFPHREDISINMSGPKHEASRPALLS
jgi:hypothetical protein